MLTLSTAHIQHSFFTIIGFHVRIYLCNNSWITFLHWSSLFWNILMWNLTTSIDEVILLRQETFETVGRKGISAWCQCLAALFMISYYSDFIVSVLRMWLLLMSTAVVFAFTFTVLQSDALTGNSS